MAFKLGGKILTQKLRELGQLTHEMLPDGTMLTRDEALAELLWKMALGWEEEFRDDNGTLKKKIHPPQAWALQYVWERKEGKAPNAISEDTTGRTAAQKVRELSVERLNKLATKVTAGGPPKYVPKGAGNA